MAATNDSRRGSLAKVALCISFLLSGGVPSTSSAFLFPLLTLLCPGEVFPEVGSLALRLLDFLPGDASGVAEVNDKTGAWSSVELGPGTCGPASSKALEMEAVALGDDDVPLALTFALPLPLPFPFPRPISLLSFVSS